MNKFRLHRIMEVKRKVLEDKEGELDGAAKELAALNLGIDALAGDIEETYKGFIGATLSGQDFSVIKDYLAHLERKRLNSMEEMAALQESMDLLKAELLGLLKELKMLETLESKMLKGMKRAENRKDQKSLDQLALRLDMLRH